MDSESVNTMDSAALVEKLSESRIAIYGTGYAADNFYRALQIRGLERKAICFAQTCTDEEKRTFKGLPVMSLDELSKTEDVLICLAVHEAIRDEIVKSFSERQIDNYVWVHPNIFELALGCPVKRGADIKVRDIIRNQGRNNYYFAVRYLAIGNYFERNNYGFDLYLKVLKLQCEDVTAEKRLTKFRELIANWVKYGYKEESSILLDEKYRLIDGTHRTTLAFYLKQEYIKADVFPASDHYYEVAKESDFLPADLLKKSGFKQEEINLMEAAQIEIWEMDG